MCGRIATGGRAPEYLREPFDANALAEVLAYFGRYPVANVPPSADIPVLRIGGDSGSLQPEMMRWGLIPRWTKPGKLPGNTFNARSETVAEKPTFRDAFRKRRCLVPVAGYYEWKGEKGDKQRYFIRDPEQPIVFAGLWGRWEGGEAPLESCTIITRSSDASPLHWLHHRTPVMLRVDDFDAWLYGDPADADKLFRKSDAIDPDVYATPGKVDEILLDEWPKVEQDGLDPELPF